MPGRVTAATSLLDGAADTAIPQPATPALCSLGYERAGANFREPGK